MPPFLSFLLAKVFDFSVLWVATNAALVNIHSCKVSTERNVAGGGNASDSITGGCTYVHLGAPGRKCAFSLVLPAAIWCQSSTATCHELS